jgi:transposase
MSMNSDTLFAMALGLPAPWSVTKVDFVHEPGSAQQLHLHIGYASGSKFKDEAGIDCPVHDSVQRKWQHLNFFEHHCMLHCDVPRITTSKGKVRNANVPWAREGSGFTLLFEAFALALIEREMPVNRVAQVLGATPSAFGQCLTTGWSRHVCATIPALSRDWAWMRPPAKRATATSP